jgi:hypothetical protein
MIVAEDSLIWVRIQNCLVRDQNSRVTPCSFTDRA